MIYSTADFRRNLREAFEQAEHTTVWIKKHDKVFMLKLTPHREVPVIELPEKMPSLPDGKITTASTPEGPNEFMNAIEAMPHYRTDPVPNPDSGELSCCTRSKPCQHWQFNGEKWINSLSGREREVDGSQ